ncbi:DUF2163 domain-containing protein [Parvularcula marina]|uniref:DUF2163 domain-containing protein n=1 Tax=Parvularcula marina TaxID=2292771 RepID=A0A371RKG8_9PROT|nr:DUF2163 domain-containing protein [Parvularcula marina]RFB05937.1 DUF2163 domain-containing protein [Parvularcula marina]
MRPEDPYTKDRFDEEAPSLCTCWRIIRQDDAEIGLTDHDRDISFTGTLFRSAGGAMGSSLEATASLSPDNADIIGVLDPDLLGADALEAGFFDEADIQVWRVDWADPDARLLLRTGRLGEVERTGEGFRAEFRSLKAQLGQVAGRIYGRTCDAALGDTRCGVDLQDTSYHMDGVISGGDSRRLEVTVGTKRTAGFYTGGAVIIDDGPLAGVIRAIREHGDAGEDESILLWEALPQELSPGTSVRLIAGCDKQFGTCASKFSNQLNFRGFPHIPGNDVLMATARPGDGS